MVYQWNIIFYKRITKESMQKLEEVTAVRVSELQSKLFNKNNSKNSQKCLAKNNLQTKFSILEHQILLMQEDVKFAASKTDESKRYLRRIKEELDVNQLPSIEGRMMEEIKKLDKFIKYSTTEAVKRNQKLWGSCKDRIVQIQQLKDSMKKICNKIENIQHALGMFSLHNTI